MNAHTDMDELAFRASVVGASEVAALFGASPWLTEFELYHRKAGNIDTPEFATEERQQAGVRLEGAIVDWACDKWGYVKTSKPKRLQFGRLGGHPDQYVTCPERGPGVLEVKTVDRLIYRDWGDEPPLHYQLQALTYAGLAKREWADLIVLIGGNQLERFQIAARPKIYTDICLRVEEFWRRVEEGRPPLPDFTRDGDTLGEIYTSLGLDTLDLGKDNLAPAAAAEYLAAHAEAKAAEARKKAAQAEIMHKMVEAASGEALPATKRVVATMPGFQVTATLIDGIPDRPAKPGEIIKGRKSYRRFSIKETSE